MFTDKESTITCSSKGLDIAAGNACFFHSIIKSFICALKHFDSWHPSFSNDLIIFHDNTFCSGRSGIYSCCNTCLLFSCKKTLSPGRGCECFHSRKKGCCSCSFSERITYYGDPCIFIDITAHLTSHDRSFCAPETCRNKYRIHMDFPCDDGFCPRH